MESSISCAEPNKDKRNGKSFKYFQKLVSGNDKPLVKRVTIFVKVILLGSFKT